MYNGINLREHCGYIFCWGERHPIAQDQPVQKTMPSSYPSPPFPLPSVLIQPGCNGPFPTPNSQDVVACRVLSIKFFPTNKMLYGSTLAFSRAGKSFFFFFIIIFSNEIVCYFQVLALPPHSVRTPSSISAQLPHTTLCKKVRNYCILLTEMY